jgi:hypothetical protein
MDILKPYNNVWHSWPVRAFGAVVVQSTRPMLGRLMGPSLTEPEIRRRQTETPLLKAELGAAAMRQGIAAGSEELRNFGGAMVVRAVDDALKNNDIIVQSAVTDVAASLPVEDFTGNPMVSPEDAAAMTSILNETRGS